MSADVDALRSRRSRLDDEINQVRLLGERFRSIARAAERGDDVDEPVRRALVAFDRYGTTRFEDGRDGPTQRTDEGRRRELAYLVEPDVLRAAVTATELDERDERLVDLRSTAGQSGLLEGAIRTIRQRNGKEGKLEQVWVQPLRALIDYVEGGVEWPRVYAELDRATDPSRIDRQTLELIATPLSAVFELLTVACVAARDRYAQLLVERLETVYEHRDPVDRLEDAPALLLPVRLETRFVEPSDPDELRIRVYPDQIHVDSHEPELIDEEVTAGRQFWAKLYLGWQGDAAQEDDSEAGPFVDPSVQQYANGVDLEAYERRVDADESVRMGRYDELKALGWDRLVERFGSQRAAYIVEAVTPVDAGSEPGTDESTAETLLRRPTDSATLPERVAFESADRHDESWSKRATARLLPDLWVAILEWDDDGETARTAVTGEIIPRGLAMGPAVEPGSTGDEMDWLFDFDRALDVGMGLSVPLADLEGFNPETDAIESLYVVGMNASMDAEETPEAVRSLFDAHRFTDGLSLLPTGTPTNLESAPDDEPLDPPAPTASDDRTDGALLARALGIDGPNPFERVPNGDGTTYADARHVNNVLWPATLGYYLRHVAVPNEFAADVTLADGSTGWPSAGVDGLEQWLRMLDAGRSHFVEYVRGNGPLPTVRVGNIPYGVLPVGDIDEPDELFGRQRDLSEQIASVIRSLRPLWASAITDQPLERPSDTIGASRLDPAHGEWNAIDAIERSGVSHGTSTGDRFTNDPEWTLHWGNQSFDPLLGQEAESVSADLEGAWGAIENALPPETADLLYDARASYLRRTTNAPSSASTFAHEFVDSAFDEFVDVLRDASFERLQMLSAVLSLTAEDDFLLVEEVLEWAGLDLDALELPGADDDGEVDPAERRAVLETIWDEEFPASVRHALVCQAIERSEIERGGFLSSRALFFDTEIDDEESDEWLDAVTHPRLVAASSLARSYGDAGSMTSVLRSLTHYSTMQTYVDGRLRLGLALNDPPRSDPSQVPGLGAASNDLTDPLPSAESDDYAYADVLGDAIAGTDDGGALPDGVSVPQSVVSFGESLERLQGMDRSRLASLAAGSLDATSHRLDAWKTSLVTARLFAGRAMGRRPATPLSGLCVGGYGYVEGLRPAAQVDAQSPAFVHAPSGEHANTAALLRSGYDAAESDELREALGVDLSAERVQDALWLLDGVRRGTDLGELLGARLERRMHEVTVGSDDDSLNLMRWKHELREAFPAVRDQLEETESSTGPDEDGASVAHSDVLNGYELVRAHQSDEFDLATVSTENQAGDTLVPSDADVARFDDVIEELADDIDAVSDLLVAETAHQIARGDPEKGGASLEGLERAEGVPEPEVTEVQRSETGVTHRHLLVFDPTEEIEASTPRAQAEPTLEAWLESVIPAHENVECLVEWTQTGRDDDDETGDNADEEVVLDDGIERLELADLELSNLDLLALSGDHRAGRSELDARIRYHLVRHGDVPTDATLSIRYRDVEDPAAYALATVLEVARSLSSLLDETRPATGEDFTHPSEPTSSGYTDENATTLADRYDDIDGDESDGLGPIKQSLDDVLALLERAGDGDSVEDGHGSVPELVEYAVDTAFRTIESLPADGLESALETIAAADPSEIASHRFALAPLGDPEDLLLEEPGTFDESVTVEASPTIEKTVVDEAGERESELEGEPVENESLPPRVDRPRTRDREMMRAARDLVRTHRRLASVREQLHDVDDALERPAMLESYENAATAFGEARSHYRRAVRYYDAARTSYREEAYGRARAIVRRARREVSRAEERASDALEAAEPDDSLIWIDDIPDDTTAMEAPTVSVWGTDGASMIESNAVGDVDLDDDTLSLSLDLSSVNPGSWLLVTVRSGDRLLYRRAGYVGRPEPELTETLTRLGWLRWAHERVRTADEELSSAVDAVPWDDVEAAIEAVDNESTRSLPDELDLEDVWDVLVGDDDVAGLADVELTTLETGLESVRPWAEQLSEHIAVSRPSLGPADATYALGSDENRSPLFAATAARTIAGLEDDVDGDTRTSALEALATIPGEAIRELEAAESDWKPEGTDDPVALSVTQQRLATWLTHPEAIDDASVASALNDTVARLDGEQTDAAETFAERFEEALPAALEVADVVEAVSPLASELEEGVDDVDSLPSVAETGLDHRSDALEPLDELAAMTDTLEEIDDGDVDPADIFRLEVLEVVRDALYEAGWYGIYGAIPESPAGYSQKDERLLAEQAPTVYTKLTNRIELVDAVEIPSNPDEDPEETVEAQLERLDTLFDGTVSVLAPFEPVNAAELEETFADDPANLAEDPLAVETWFQRAAQVTERVADGREVRSYASAIAGESPWEFGVGQLPYVPDDEWIGIDGVEPSPGTVSIVAGLGSEGGAIGSGPVAGIFVDEWVEGVAAETQDTEVALRYDAPGSRAPGSILLAVPPRDDGWSIKTVVDTVEETMMDAKLRSVDSTDLREETPQTPVPLLPGPYYAERVDRRPSEPVMEPERVAWHSPRTRAACHLHLLQRAIDEGVTSR
ncbi:hypothetical protein [Halovivax gelatinilyticus]|uniref:hypothetical protein n=1 Tax=Halovivax gelatinilyticus TaxID=2961597 RepID=UPI0020CA2932|nr:hypothetical protein [Halovivax gelatinilyticus]